MASRLHVGSDALTCQLRRAFEEHRNRDGLVAPQQGMHALTVAVARQRHAVEHARAPQGAVDFKGQQGSAERGTLFGKAVTAAGKHGLADAVAAHPMKTQTPLQRIRNQRFAGPWQPDKQHHQRALPRRSGSVGIRGDGDGQIDHSCRTAKAAESARRPANLQHYARSGAKDGHFVKKPQIPVQRYLITGVLTMIPLLLTWVVFEFMLGLLSRFSAPWVKAVFSRIENAVPALSGLLGNNWLQTLIAVIITLLALIALGWLANKVIGKRLIALVERLIDRIPLVQSVYGGTKKLLAALQTKPDKTQRVVLIDFPTSEMKAVGFVTRVLTDGKTGAQIAAVYVPTTPNPTSGYLELVPTDRLVPTDWTVDQAMSFIISGGAVAPERTSFGFAVSETRTEENGARDHLERDAGPPGQN